MSCAVLKKPSGRVSDEVLLLHANAPIYKCNIVHAGIGRADFVELNYSAYSPSIALSDYYLLNKFVRSKNFSDDDETMNTVEEYLNKLD